MYNSHNELLLSFSFFDEKFDPGNWLIDSFSGWFSSYPHSSKIKNHIRNLNDIIFRVLFNLSSSIVISDASIKNHVATSILHIHSHNKPVIKTIHWAVNVITTKAELFAMQCSINQVVGVLWQPLITKTNDHTSSKSLKLNIKWEVHKKNKRKRKRKSI